MSDHRNNFTIALDSDPMRRLHFGEKNNEIGESMKRFVCGIREKRYSPPFSNFLIEMINTGRTVIIEKKGQDDANRKRVDSS